MAEQYGLALRCATVDGRGCRGGSDFVFRSLVRGEDAHAEFAAAFESVLELRESQHGCEVEGECAGVVLKRYVVQEARQGKCFPLMPNARRTAWAHPCVLDGGGAVLPSDWRRLVARPYVAHVRCIASVTEDDEDGNEARSYGGKTAHTARQCRTNM